MGNDPPKLIPFDPTETEEQTRARQARYRSISVTQAMSSFDRIQARHEAKRLARRAALQREEADTDELFVGPTKEGAK